MNKKITLAILALCLLASLGFQQSNLLLVGQGKPAGGGGGTTVTFNTTTTNGNISGSAALALPFSGAGLTTGNAFVIMVAFHSVTATVLSVCDGTGTNQCTGGSTYNSETILRNTSDSIQVWYTCNYQGVAANGLSILLSASAPYIYAAGAASTGNTTTGTGCADQYKDSHGTTGTAYSTGAMSTTTTAHDLLFSFAMNDTGGTYTAGTDGQGNTMGIQANDSGVAAVASFNETTTAAFNSSITGTSTQWELAEFAIK
jgi:hypothetical protein